MGRHIHIKNVTSVEKFVLVHHHNRCHFSILEASLAGEKEANGIETGLHVMSATYGYRLDALVSPQFGYLQLKTLKLKNLCFPVICVISIELCEKKGSFKFLKSFREYLLIGLFKVLSPICN